MFSVKYEIYSIYGSNSDFYFRTAQEDSITEVITKPRLRRRLDMFLEALRSQLLVFQATRSYHIRET